MVFAFKHWAPGCVQEWGAQLPSRENSYFCSVSGCLGGNEVSQQALQVSGIVFGSDCEIEPLENTFGVFKVILRCHGSSACAARMFRGSVKMPRIAGKTRCGSQKNNIISKNGVSKNWAKNIVRPRPLKCLCFTWSRIDKKQGETTENVVPKWRWNIKQFLLRRVRNMPSSSHSKGGPIYFSFHCTSSPIHPQPQKKNYVVFLHLALILIILHNFLSRLCLFIFSFFFDLFILLFLLPILVLILQVVFCSLLYCVLLLLTYDSIVIFLSFVLLLVSPV